MLVEIGKKDSQLVEYDKICRMNKNGRPTKLDARMAERIYFLAAKGFTDEEMVNVLGIARSTLSLWKTSKVFSDTLKGCKEAIDNQVENALLRRALGHEYVERQIIKDVQGQISAVKETTKYLVPDTTAAIFWLKNRRKAEWRETDKSEVKVQSPTTIQSVPDAEKESLVGYLSDSEKDSLERILAQVISRRNKAKWIQEK